MMMVWDGSCSQYRSDLLWIHHKLFLTWVASLIHNDIDGHGDHSCRLLRLYNSVVRFRTGLKRLCHIFYLLLNYAFLNSFLLAACRNLTIRYRVWGWLCTLHHHHLLCVSGLFPIWQTFTPIQFAAIFIILPWQIQFFKIFRYLNRFEQLAIQFKVFRWSIFLHKLHEVCFNDFELV